MQPQPEFNSYYNNSSRNSKSKTATTNNKKSQQQQQEQQQQQSEEAATAPQLQQQQQQQHIQRQPEHQSRILRTTRQQTINERPRVIKSKQPLLHFKFYLDIHDHQLSRYIEKQIQLLGGAQEFFLDANITHFITDKEDLPANVLNNNNNNQSNCPVTPQSPATPQTPIKQPKSATQSLEFKNAAANKSGSTYKVAQTRADAILSRVRLQDTTKAETISSPITRNNNTLSEPTYTIWQTEYAVRFFKKVQHELKAYLQPENRINQNQTHKLDRGVAAATNCAHATDITTLKGGYIKFESIKRSCRPYYHSFRAPFLDWPKISLKSEEGAFCLTAEKPFAMTRKSRSRSSQCATPLKVTVPPLRKAITNTTIQTKTVAANKTQSQCRQIKDSTDKQCGVCEICKVEYDTLTIHLKTKDHEYFARNTQNFIALDTLIQSSADVNKFLAEQVDNNTTVTNNKKANMEEMEVEVDGDNIAHMDVDASDPLEQPLDINNLSPPLREKSKRSTKGKHSSEKFQNKRAKTTNVTVTKTPPKTLQITPTKNINYNNNHNNNNNGTTRRKFKANSSSPIRPFPPPSSLYKVVETSQVEGTPRRGGVAGCANEDVTASPSLIVKIKKVRNTALVRLNGEAESFMFPKTQRRASSDLPTDVDRQSSSERLRTSIYSSSSLDSSSISDIVGNIESPELNKRKTKGAQSAHKKSQCFQSAPIQPDEQLKRLRKSSTTATPIMAKKIKVENKNENVGIADLSPPSAAAAIVAATAKITLPAATRKSSRMATAIVSAATTSSRLLRAAAEVVKKSGRTSKSVGSYRNLTTTTKLVEAASVAEETPQILAKEEKGEKDETMISDVKTTPNSNTRRCRLTAGLTVVKMEDRMGDSSATNTDNEDVEIKAEIDENVPKTAITKKTKNLMNLKSATTPMKSAETFTPVHDDEVNDDDDDDEDDDDDDDNDIDNDDKADKDFKYKLKKAQIKPRSRRGRRKKFTSKISAAITTAMLKKQSNNSSSNNKKSLNITKSQQKINKSTPHYDYMKSERIQEQIYAFERVPDTDLWYRAFMRQDNCEESYFEYFASTKYHKLPYELGPIPYTHTNLITNCCKLCEPIKPREKSEKEEQKYEKKISIKAENITETVEKTCEIAKSKSMTTTPYALKHKKLHLLQRYRQEQEALQQEKQKQEEEQEKLKEQANCQIKAENLANEVSNGMQIDLERRERAGSIHSTSSSCASTSTTQNTKKSAFRNKLLTKAALSNFELPPRKSPREHASTLALVSIIKQRQESKPNSDAEELINSLPTTPVPKEETPVATPAVTALPNTTHNIRSAAATPIEEMCFATEISENVKRMRRGRNKYDHSPPYVLTKSRRTVRQKFKTTTTTTLNTKLRDMEVKSEIMEEQVLRIKPQITHEKPLSKYMQKKAAAQANMIHSKSLMLPPSVRKTGQKKGVLQFSMDDSALKALDATLEPDVSTKRLEYEIDEFLTNTGKDLDMDDLLLFNNEEVEEAVTIDANEQKSETKESEEQIQKTTDCFINTPPATDYFSSDFDLCDLLHDANNTILVGDEAQKRSHESKHISLYNTVALKKYFRKRKYMKSNRTGWPKLQKKKYSMRHQTLIANELKKYTVASTKVTITPPDSEGDALLIKTELKQVDEHMQKEKEQKPQAETEKQQIKEHVSDEETLYDGADSIPEEEDADTVVDSIVDEEEQDVANVESDKFEEYEKAVEADDEDEFNEVLEGENDENTITNNNSIDNNKEIDNDYNEQLKYDEVEHEDDEDYEPKTKRPRRNSSLGKAFVNSLSSNHKQKNAVDEDMEADTFSLMATTSTPTTNLARTLRRTPQINGSLLSCHSPSERAGDNSDIFTVSSDGLDTDLDLSNPHAHAHSKQDEQHNVSCNSRTNGSKRTKYDITKYVKNPAANTCAAEAATAAAKSLAIAQFLKKEVRVSCRRIRAPFRRFRYRR